MQLQLNIDDSYYPVFLSLLEQLPKDSFTLRDGFEDYKKELQNRVDSYKCGEIEKFKEWSEDWERVDKALE